MSTATITAPIQTGTWNVDPAHSKVGFSVKHMGISNVRGEFTEFEGVLEIGETLADSVARGTVKVGSVTTNEDKRDEHLRSSDFFGAKANPELRFESTSIDQINDDEFRITGNLTMNGQTNTVTLDAEYQGGETDPWGGERVALEVSGHLNRAEYGMTFNQALGSGNMLVGDKVQLSLDVEAVKA